MKTVINTCMDCGGSYEAIRAKNASRSVRCPECKKKFDWISDHAAYVRRLRREGRNLTYGKHENRSAVYQVIRDTCNGWGFKTRLTGDDVKCLLNKRFIENGRVRSYIEDGVQLQNTSTGELFEIRDGEKVKL